MNNQWSTKSYRRWLVDMHIPDWNEKFLSKIDPENYAEMMVLSGTDTAIIYAASCLGICNWPTKSGYMHKQLRGRDLIKELITACRKKDLNIVVYYNIWSRWAYDTHPEWRIVLPNGKGTVENGWRYGLCCPNTGFRDYVAAQLREICEGYDFDGMWIDMIGWFGKICYCDSCRKRFLAETGHELPQIINWDDPVWVKFQRKREEWFAEFAKLVSSTIKNAKPGATVALQHTSIIHGWAGGINYEFTRQSDYLAGDFGGGPLEESAICKLLNGLTQTRPVEFMMPYCENLSHHTTEKPEELLQMEAYAAIANQCCYVLISAVDPEGTLNSADYETGGRIYHEIKRYEKYLTPNAEIMADVAIYWSLPSMMNIALNGTDTKNFKMDLSYYKNIQKIVRTLIDENIAFTIITEKDLTRLDDYKLLILSDVMVMNDNETTAFREFVKKGGNLYASGMTSLYNKHREKQPDFQLADIFGVSFSGKSTDENITYISPAGHLESFWGSCTKEYPLMLNGKQVIVSKRDDSQVLGSITLPYGDSMELNRFGTANSNPPGINTSYPSLIRNRFGKGDVIYCAGPLELQPFTKHRKILSGIFDGMLECRTWKSNAPKPVEIIVFKDEPDSRLIINILNYQETVPPIPVRNIKIKINMDNILPEKLYIVPDEIPVEYQMTENGDLEFTASEVNMYSMYILKYRKK